MTSPTAPTPRVAIVTGAAQGIGRAISLRLASEGFSLGIADLSSSIDKLQDVVREVEQMGVRCVAIPTDVSKEKDVYELVAQTVTALGRLDVMVANAGIAPVASFLEMTPELLDTIYSVNVRGVFLCYQAAAKQMIKQGKGGRLIAACSTSGLRTGPNVSGYCSSKFAVRALNQGAALEFGKYGITANVYCPTVVETDMWKNIDEHITNMQGIEAGTYTQKRRDLNPMRRNATPEDIAGMVAFLASKDASFVSGQAMQVTGADWLS
ncbi:hypothetical protein CI109_101733 [Kwoniella shandongensis]|uniref:Uncharacterized protein n=1 Tax=Kwoniella shandongensis TaxID=1734106 RepID=A0A5M6C5R0_9TREE|nr:uncharacterized protein CI109_001144 [Kwoniella shandongensis]KAA5530343.1 hypothetical protein CI109_001144 [Kwoniella shandongensis]